LKLAEQHETIQDVYEVARRARAWVETRQPSQPSAPAPQSLAARERGLKHV